MANKNPRIDQLAPGQEVVLRFGSGADAYDSTHTFLGIEGEGTSREAVFSDGGEQWRAYRYEGKWAYGLKGLIDTKPVKLSLVAVL